MKKETEKVFQQIAERWFLAEPMLFAVYCSHHLKPNTSLSCVMRTGKGNIEYNPDMIANMTESAIEEHLKAEIIRILLKHPYDRQPKECSAFACTEGSDCTLSTYYNNWKSVKLSRPSDFNLPEKKYYEWYAINIDKQIQKEELSNGAASNENSSESTTGDSSKESTSDEYSSEKTSDEISVPQQEEYQAKAEQSELWEEDDLMQVSINTMIENAKSWGSIPGDLVETIIASTKARIDYRKILAGFRASCISMRRTLTRMRPNRRTGFQNMGSIYRFKTNLLVAVDVSGSVSSKSLAHFYSVINRFFHYGVENIDVMQFDCAAGEVKNIKKASRKIEVFGRGGTDFQCVIDYAQEAKCYDGIVIFTDGYAPPPVLPQPFRPRLLWICENEDSYKQHHEWMEKLGRACTIDI